MKTLQTNHPTKYFNVSVDKMYYNGRLRNVLSLALGYKRFYLFL